MIIADELPTSKTCPSCARDLPLSQYHKRNSGSRLSIQTYCKPCMIERVKQSRDKEAARAYAKLYYSNHPRYNHPDYKKNWNAANPDRLKVHQRRYYERHQQRLTEKQRDYRLNKSEDAQAHTFNYMREWRANNKDRIAEYARQYYRDHRASHTAKAKAKYWQEKAAALKQAGK